MFAGCFRNRRARHISRLAFVLFLLAVGALPESVARSSEEADGAPRHGPARMLRDDWGVPVRGLRNQQESTNWSGYVLPTFQTGVKYTSAQGNWVVPGVTNEDHPQSAVYSSSWLGIGGKVGST